jgi:phenylacetate-CoA ligase
MARYEHWTVTNHVLGIRGELAIIHVVTPIAQQVEWLRKERPRYLHTYPTNARALARRLGGKPPEGLEKLFLVGETLSDEGREEIAAGFGDRIGVVERYGAVECGQLALQCPTGTQLHVQSESVLLEVLDNEDRAVPPGGSGRVVVTPLHNYAFPLIRYRLDDIVTVGAPCACGRGLPVIAKVLGRERHIFRFPDGAEVFPALYPAMKMLRPREWQVAQVGPLEIEIRYVLADPTHRVDWEAMTAYIRRQLHPDVAVRYRRVDDLPRLPGGKFHEYVNEFESIGARPRPC